MYQIQTLNKISPIGLENFDRSKYTWGDEIANPDAILVRSASMHEMELPASVKAIARAGAGVNNIPLDQCSEKGIVVFNTPGANANAVKELVLLGLLLSSRRVPAAMDWVKTLKGAGADVSKQVEKGKSQFVGPEIKGKKLGVIGLGAIGALVCNAAVDLGMDVYGYDPYISVDAAWRLSQSVKHAKSLKEIFESCDYITLHVPATPETKGMINTESLATMKNGVRILNFSRGDLVVSADVIAAVASGKLAAYVTDFPTDEMLGVDNIISMPHLGASTPESEDNCAVMAVAEIIDFLENGNITNSVNMPAASMARSGEKRICVVNRNMPKMVSAMSTVISENGCNIENMLNKSRGDYAYTIFDVTGSVKDQLKTALESIEGVIDVRMI